MTLSIVPITLRQANAFVEALHRHHKPARGCKFCVGVTDGEVLRGVAVAGRPVARALDTGWNLEVNRLCTDGTANACSKLYSTVAKAARVMGYRRIITYTLPSEGGASLKAAGWKLLGEAGGGSWSCASRPREDKAPLDVKWIWEAP